jgi:DNA-binding FadR family transcriptional regulator
MAKSRDPFFMALERIREAARTGAYPPGRPIVIIEEARRLGVSTTPVREALAWLCGEGLIERGPAGGFLAVRLDAGAVRDRYAFRLACLTAAMDMTAGLPAYGRSPRARPDPAAALEALFDRIVRRAGNGMLTAAHERVSGQLRRFRDAEARMFADLEAEAGALLALAAEEANGALRQALGAYHDRRVQAASILALDAARRADRDGAEAGPS